jgi:hypothetical protein
MRRLRSIDSDVRVQLPDGSSKPLMDYLIPTALLMLAALLLMTSMFLPYWSMTLFAPQYPDGLQVNVYVNQLEGDVREVDSLNHYLGMPRLDEGGQLERSISRFSIVALGLLLMGAVFVHNRWAAVMALPATGYPFIFLADLFYILYTYGHSIDPQSALGGAIAPFTPPLLGPGTIGQFRTIASAEAGLILAFLAVGVILLGLWFHRAAYKPIADARLRLAAAPPS